MRDALNGFLIGWSGYFSYGTRWEVFRGIDYYVYERVRDFLARRHKVPGRGTRRFSYEVIYGERGMWIVLYVAMIGLRGLLTCTLICCQFRDLRLNLIYIPYQEIREL